MTKINKFYKEEFQEPVHILISHISTSYFMELIRSANDRLI